MYYGFTIPWKNKFIDINLVEDISISYIIEDVLPAKKKRLRKYIDKNWKKYKCAVI